MEKQHTRTKQRRASLLHPVITRACCTVCGEPVHAYNERDRRLMDAHPVDGRWQHERCRGGGR